MSTANEPANKPCVLGCILESMISSNDPFNAIVKCLENECECTDKEIIHVQTVLLQAQHELSTEKQ